MLQVRCKGGMQRTYQRWRDNRKCSMQAGWLWNVCIAQPEMGQVGVLVNVANHPMPGVQSTTGELLHAYGGGVGHVRCKRLLHTPADNSNNI